MTLRFNKTQEVHAAFKAIPAEKRPKKVLSVLAGVPVIALSIVGIAQEWWPWQVGVSGTVLGGFIISQEMMILFFKWFLSVLRDLLAAVGKSPPNNSSPPPGGNS